MHKNTLQHFQVGASDPPRPCLRAPNLIHT